VIHYASASHLFVSFFHLSLGPLCITFSSSLHLFSQVPLRPQSHLHNSSTRRRGIPTQPTFARANSTAPIPPTPCRLSTFELDDRPSTLLPPETGLPATSFDLSLRLVCWTRPGSQGQSILRNFNPPSFDYSGHTSPWQMQHHLSVVCSQFLIERVAISSKGCSASISTPFLST
jgi:hypothetical protein